MIDLNEIDERIAKCEKILSSNPGSQIFAALAEAHRKKGELDKAFQVCQKGLKTHPDYGSAHLVMARINLDKGMLDWAETEVEKAAKLGGNAHSIEILRCEILLAKGQLEDAIERLKKLLKADPGNDQIKKLMATAESARKLPGARPAGVNPEIKTPTLFQGEPNAGNAAPRAETAKKTPPKKPARKLSAVELMREALKMTGAFGAVRTRNGTMWVQKKSSPRCPQTLCGKSWRRLSVSSSALQQGR